MPPNPISSRRCEGNPAIVHCGPFANIAHGNNSLAADLLGLKLADFVVTEAGFGSDLGFEKLMHIVCRAGEIFPAAVVLVATTKAMKRAGGDEGGGLQALERGAANLAAHLKIVEAFGLKAVVAVNRFPRDTADELHAVNMLALEHGAFAAELCDGFARGGEGAIELAEVVADAARRDTAPTFMYDLDAPVEEKIATVARRVYGAAGVHMSQLAAAPALEALAGRCDACPSAWPRRTSHCPTTRSRRASRAALSCRCASSAPTRAQAGSSPSAPRPRPCPAFPRTPRPSASIWPPTARSSVSPDFAFFCLQAAR